MVWYVTSEGRVTWELKHDALGRSPEDQVRRHLSRMDGVTRSAYWLWELPDPPRYKHLKVERDCKDLIQAAGSAQNGMAVELIRATGPNPGHWAIGKPGTSAEDRSGSVTWGSASMQVPSGEVFSAAEAAELFLHYLSHRDVPAAFNRRPVTLDNR